MPFEHIPPTVRATAKSRQMTTQAADSGSHQARRVVTSAPTHALPRWRDSDPEEDMPPTRKMYAKGRAPSKRQPGDRKPFTGTLRCGARVAVDQPLQLGGTVIEAGAQVVVDSVFPKFRLRGEKHKRPVTVEFDDVAAAIRPLTDTELAPPSDADPESVAFDVSVLDE